MGRIIELLALINGLGVSMAWLARLLRKRRASNLDHIKTVERENEEIDRILRRIK